jgi:hypothetical protein
MRTNTRIVIIVLTFEGRVNKMAICKGQCTSCGNIIDVDPAVEAALCSYCGAPFAVSSAIKAYTQQGQSIMLEDGLVKANTLLKLKDWVRAQKAFEDLASQFPHDARTWLGIARAVSFEKTRNDVDEETFKYLVDTIGRVRTLNLYVADNSWDVYLDGEEERLQEDKRIKEQMRVKLQSEYDSLVQRASITLRYETIERNKTKKHMIMLGIVLAVLAAGCVSAFFLVEALHTLWVMLAAAAIGLISVICVIVGICVNTKVIALPASDIEALQASLTNLKSLAERHGVVLDTSAPIRTSIVQKKVK